MHHRASMALMQQQGRNSMSRPKGSYDVGISEPKTDGADFSPAHYANEVLLQQIEEKMETLKGIELKISELNGLESKIDRLSGLETKVDALLTRIERALPHE